MATQILPQENDPPGGGAASPITRSTPIEQLPEFLRVDELAVVLGLGRGSAYEMAADPRLRAVRCGRLLRIPRAALLALVKEQA